MPAEFLWINIIEGFASWTSSALSHEEGVLQAGVYGFLSALSLPVGVPLEFRLQRRSIQFHSVPNKGEHYITID